MGSGRSEMIILGISASHDASACLLIDGNVEVAIQAERLSRVKHDGRPTLDGRSAADYCLESRGLAPDDVDFFAFNIQPIVPGYFGLSQPVAASDFDLFDPFSKTSIFVSHHLAHAFSAFCGSGYQSSSVQVIDGSGGNVVGADDLIVSGPDFKDYLYSDARAPSSLHAESAYVFDRDRYSLVRRKRGRSFNTRCGSSSIGETWAAVSSFLFSSWHDAGKLMGLAPYGDASGYDTFLIQDDEGDLVYGDAWKYALARPSSSNPEPMQYADLAARLQADLNEILSQRFRWHVHQLGSSRLAYTGGVALNSVANYRAKIDAGIEELFVYPASSDAGVAVGAACAAFYSVTGRVPVGAQTSDFLGHPYSDADCRLASEKYDHVIMRKPYSASYVAKKLTEGEIVGLFEGGAEFGPRALGHRSILADPRDEENWKYINAEIKNREDFRPFAPCVLAEHAQAVLEDPTGPDEYMLNVVKVRESARERLGATTHVDGSARVQLVRASSGTKLSSILDAFHRRTSMPVLLNTSMNVTGEPIVETPVQAIELLLTSQLDALVMGAEVIEPVPVSELCDDDVIVINPHTTLQIEHEAGDPTVTIKQRGGRENSGFPIWVLDLLLPTGALPTPVGTLVQASGRQGNEVRTLLGAFVTLRICLLARPTKESTASALRSVENDQRPTKVDAHRRLVHGYRVRDESTCYRLAQEIAHSRLGVSRVADLTDYDRLGIPVVGTVRTFQGRAQISGTQGKGNSLVEAHTSALLEALERHSANDSVETRKAIQVVSGSQSSIGASGGRIHLDNGMLQRRVDPDEEMEWATGRELGGEEVVHVPASMVLFPYDDPRRVSVPATTGIAVGNTRYEAVAHALLEVIERFAVSRFVKGEAAREIGQDELNDEAAELLDRFRVNGIEIVLLDLSHLAPTGYVVNALSRERAGIVSAYPIGGQGASLEFALAVRRALLEVAQSRVVAIQGSREDLIRHGDLWADGRAANSVWDTFLARRDPTLTRVCRDRSVPPRTDAEFCRAVAEDLTAGGFADSFVVDLTRTADQFHIVKVLVPGLHDRLVHGE